MALSNQSTRQGSTAVRLWTTAQTKYEQWADQAHTVRLARRLFAEGEPQTVGSDFSGVSERSPDSSEGSIPSPSESSHSNTGSTASLTGPQSTSVVYRGVRSGRRLVESSWLYGWLTAEPESEVIVIDLRETLSAGPVLAQIEQRIREFISVMPTSGGLRSGYQLRARFLEQPIRILSIGLIAVVMLAFLGLTTSGEPIGMSTFVLFGLLLLAARGTQTTHTWAQLTDTRWYQFLASTFEPPAPPERVETERSSDFSETARQKVDRENDQADE